jgi:prephenate dehydrogenase
MTDSTAEMIRLSRLIDEALDELRTQAVKVAEMEHSYRYSRARAWSMVERTDRNGVKRLAAEIEADVDGITADLRMYRDQAEALRQAALEAVRSRRQQLSAWQSWMAADRAEAEFARTAP